MKKNIFLLLLILIPTVSFSQHFAVKNNLLFDALATPNLGVEIGLWRNVTLDISGNYNPFEFNGGKKFKHWLVQPEARYWFCERFSKWYVGIHAHVGHADVAKINLPLDIYTQLRRRQYKGNFAGAGVSIGYQLPIHKRWNLEFALGGGYAGVKYDRFDPKTGEQKESDATHNYFGLTKASISIMYIIK